MTSPVAFATTRADAAAVDAAREHHAELLGALSFHTSELVAAARAGEWSTVEAARDVLADWCRRELVPHARAEEEALYPAATDLEAGRLLVAALVEEHATLQWLVEVIAAADDPVVAASAGIALRVLFETHQRVEDDQLMPLLAGASGISLGELLSSMHEAVAEATQPDREQQSAAPADAHHPVDAHVCGCGEVDGGEPELDTRLVPHAIRHATVFGALDAVAPTGSLVLVASHDPLPLLAQVDERWPGTFDVTYLQRGPDVWRLRFVRRP